MVRLIADWEQLYRIAHAPLQGGNWGQSFEMGLSFRRANEVFPGSSSQPRELETRRPRDAAEHTISKD